MHNRIPSPARIGRALATVVILTLGASILSACTSRGVSIFDPNLNKTTAKWDDEKGEYVTEPNPNYRQTYSFTDSRGD